MIQKLACIILIILAISAQNILAEAPKYPFIIDFAGRVEIKTKGNQIVKVEKKSLLRELALIETGERSFLKIQWDPVRYIMIEESSRLNIPNISWETGEAPILILEKGSFLWDQSDRADYNIAMKSPLFEFIAPLGMYVLSYSPAKALAELKVIKGSQEFFAMNGEKSVTVKSGEKASFQGVLDGNDIAYDILLKGKKIPKGQLSAVTPFTKEEAFQYSEKRQSEIKRAAEIEMGRLKALQSRKLLGMLCKEPYAKFNQCAWICKGPGKSKNSCMTTQNGQTKCLRSRCNASGQWADETEIPWTQGQGICKGVPVVKACDY